MKINLKWEKTGEGVWGILERFQDNQEARDPRKLWWKCLGFVVLTFCVNICALWVHGFNILLNKCFLWWWFQGYVGLWQSIAQHAHWSCVWLSINSDSGALPSSIHLRQSRSANVRPSYHLHGEITEIPSKGGSGVRDHKYHSVSLLWYQFSHCNNVH